MDIAELYHIKEAEQSRRKPKRIRCCTAAGCQSSGAEGVMQTLETAITTAGLEQEVEVSSVGCLRFCGRGPLVATDPDGKLYEQVTATDAASIAEALQGKVTTAQSCDPQQPFFAGQQAIVLENSGQIDPERIEEYIAVGGYEPLYHALYELTPGEVVEAITQSGLRGRGGGGYPTGLKWATVAKMPGEQKYVICNADEGDPGAFMDRSVLESDPHRVWVRLF